MESFWVETRTDDQGRSVVVPHGDLDLATQRQLREEIQELLMAGRVNLVVDLDHTTFLDSTALGTLIGARRRAHALKGSLALRCHRTQLLNVLRVTALDRVFTILEDE
ncbi:STAS domain-containing protein [Nocardioides campestrisoli]|uniref:STAS domain-containing protein n=1 Tax=Nocardioides campestrisoli TaxID=2736757 RepID=UPI0015E6D8D8|nr:STAS domain-containing protein [Nocardioides campestrisoli]